MNISGPEEQLNDLVDYLYPKLAMTSTKDSGSFRVDHLDYSGLVSFTSEGEPCI